MPFGAFPIFAIPTTLYLVNGWPWSEMDQHLGYGGKCFVYTGYFDSLVFNVNLMSFGAFPIFIFPIFANLVSLKLVIYM